MSEMHIDPYKLNDALEQILEGMQVLKERANGVSPEFQLLMNNYLSKANEAERNQARLEDAIDKITQKDQEFKKIQREHQEMSDRLHSFQKSSEIQQQDMQRELKTLKDDLLYTRKEKDDLEYSISQRYQAQYDEIIRDLNQQVNDTRLQLSETQGEYEKLKYQYNDKIQELEQITEEITSLRHNQNTEVHTLRNELEQVQNRLSGMDIQLSDERMQSQKRIKQLESQVEELVNDLRLKDRELEYKNALLDQAIKKPQQHMSIDSQPLNNKYNNTSSANNIQPTDASAVIGGNSQSYFNLINVKDENTGLIDKKDAAKFSLKDQIGGIWSKLSS